MNAEKIAGEISARLVDNYGMTALAARLVEQDIIRILAAHGISPTKRSDVQLYDGAFQKIK